MYMVISRWRPKPGREADFETVAHRMRDMMRGVPGVTFMNGIKGSDCHYAVHVYEDEATYNRIVQDPNGPFHKGAKENGIEDIAEWIGSEKGDTLD